MNFDEIKKILDFMPCQNEKFDVVLDLAKSLEPIPENLSKEEIKGCASLVYMAYQKIENKFYFYAFADSKMVAGIIFIIISIINGKSLEELKNLDIQSMLKSLNLEISFQRQSGIESVISWIKSVLDKAN